MTPLPFDLTAKKTFVNLPMPQRVEIALRDGDGILTDRGALAVTTGEHTGRTPEAKFLVREPSTEADIWWGPNKDLSPELFEKLLARIRGHLDGRELHVQDATTCADPHHRMNVRVITETAWHALFADCLFRSLAPGEDAGFTPDWHVLHAPSLTLDPKADGTGTSAVIAIHFDRQLVLIAGTQYAGEIKKSIFTVLNFLLPRQGVFPMHCAANVGDDDGDSALFFGLSGTGKTTLSADEDRELIGDDEHGWSDDGVFNMEGGCYAKTIKLTAETEPMIYEALRFGSVIENVPVDEKTRVPDFMSPAITENTRAGYPLDFIPHRQPDGRGGHPRNIFFLTCDAFGVLPPIARLTPDQAMYHFLSGYTAKVAGTEKGVTEPKVTFSACFGAPFLPMHPVRYAKMLKARMKNHEAPVWLVNTGWTGGPYGTGARIALKHTRALLKAALGHRLDDVSYYEDPVFGLSVPESCPGVPAEILRPRESWSDPAEYDEKARHLAKLFRDNFEQYAEEATDATRDAGPKVE